MFEEPDRTVALLLEDVLTEQVGSRIGRRCRQVEGSFPDLGAAGLSRGGSALVLPLLAGAISVRRPFPVVVVDGDAHHRFVIGSPLDDFEGEPPEC